MFNLPKSTFVKKIIPKNAFDFYTNTKQKKVFTEKILRITWTNKVSLDTINISGKEVKEILFFEVELKDKFEAKDLLAIIDKAIPYNIIFVIKYLDEYYISTSAKHIHPSNEDSAVIDYTFKSCWLGLINQPYTIELKNNLDWVFQNFCEQLKSTKSNFSSIKELIEKEKRMDVMAKEIEQIKSEIKRCNQFNKKVELNIRLNELTKLLESSN